MGDTVAEQDLDRNEAATPYKLQKARERGQVAKSTDIASVVVFASAMVFLTWQGWVTWQTQFRFDRALLSNASLAVDNPRMLWPLTEYAIRTTIVLAMPFLVTLVLAALIGNMLQTGPVLSFEPVKVDWARVNPVTGFKRVLSLRTVFNSARAVLKLCLLGVTIYFALRTLLPHFYALTALSPLGTVRALLSDLASVGLKMAFMLGFIALLDWVYTRREFAKQMRMSRHEIKEEIKHREGDPRIRARLRELRRDMLKKSLSLQNTRHADVLITNPTHVAVALRYVHGQMESPQLISKGSGLTAAAMRRIAVRHQIPVVQNPPLARKLFRELPIDQSVPPNLYAQVARIIVWVFAMREVRTQGGRMAVRDRRPGENGKK